VASAPSHDDDHHEAPHENAHDAPAHETHADAAHDEAPHDEAPHDHADEGEHAEHHPADALPATADAAPHEDDEEDDDDEEEEEHVEQIGGDALEEMPRRKTRSRRQYKIQEVIKRRQVLLVQVVKEERGNKGAALTTYLSLAGRYAVLMPNTARGGGISRKITDTGDRKRLKSIVQDLDVPEGMGVILRTAGASRTRAEVRRDFEYLLRMWETVRETTLKSSAPMLVYEEGSLIKRTIRDLYNKDIDEVSVAGEAGFREAKDFMRLIMPTHARNVVPWRDPQPIFVRSGVEAQLDAMFSNHVTLKSGGYIVINQTEALVAIDVNSGRSTREHNIEDTALRTNLEASDEVARQLRLRDLAGLIVVDFIDMEEGRNNRHVERRLKEALKNDRARIQVGRISHFGLLEMSRQRMRTGVLEGSTIPCPHCAGAGSVRSVASIALHVLRVLEDTLTKSATHDLVVRTRSAVALYILNHKRGHLRDIERRFGVHITVDADERMLGTVYHAIERGELATGTPEPIEAIPYVDEDPEPIEEIDEVEEEIETDDTSEPVVAGEHAAEAGEERESEGEDVRRKRRRRRRRGRGDREGATHENGGPISGDEPQPSDEALAATNAHEAPATPRTNESPGYWTRERSDEPVPFHAMADEPVATNAPAPAPHQAAPAPAPADVSPEPDSHEPVEAIAKMERAGSVEAPPAAPREATEVVITTADPDQPKRGGWWQRAKASIGGG
jgi:ribonuclease E